VSGAGSKREVVEVALRALIEAKEAERRRISWRERAARLDTRLAGLRLSRRPSELVREDRARR
jgi:hypothetical protein